MTDAMTDDLELNADSEPRIITADNHEGLTREGVLKQIVSLREQVVTASDADDQETFMDWLGARYYALGWRASAERAPQSASVDYDATLKIGAKAGAQQGYAQGLHDGQHAGGMTDGENSMRVTVVDDAGRPLEIIKETPTATFIKTVIRDDHGRIVGLDTELAQT